MHPSLEKIGWFSCQPILYEIWTWELPICQSHLCAGMMNWILLEDMLRHMQDGDKGESVILYRQILLDQISRLLWCWTASIAKGRDTIVICLNITKTFDMVLRSIFFSELERYYLMEWIVGWIRWRLANVTPIFRKGQKDDPGGLSVSPWCSGRLWNE